MESEDLLQCPYDKNHMIRPSRFPYHLVKCRENNKAIAKDLATCPFNARHRMPKQELQLHMKSCENRCQLEPLPALEHVYKDFSTWQSPPCEEDWEDESSSCAQPFILNGFGNDTPYNAHEYASNTSQTRATYGQSQGGYTNAWKPKVEKTSCAQPTSFLNGFGNNTPYNAPDYASNTSQPGATYGQSKGGHTNAWKPIVKGDIKSESQLKPVSSSEDWPRATYGQSQRGHTNAWKPKVESDVKSESQLKPVSSLEDWPSLGNAGAGKGRRY